MDNDILKEINKNENDKELVKNKIANNKNNFIREIKNGLGEDMKKNPSKVEIIKPPVKLTLWQRIKKFLNIK